MKPCRAVTEALHSRVVRRVGDIVEKHAGGVDANVHTRDTQIWDSGTAIEVCSFFEIVAKTVLVCLETMDDWNPRGFRARPWGGLPA